MTSGRFARDQRGGAATSAGSGGWARRRRGQESASTSLGGTGAQHVDRNLDVDRPRRLPSPTAIATPCRDPAARCRRSRSVRASRVSGLMIARGRCPAADPDLLRAGAQPPISSTGTRVQLRIRDRGHAVGDARTGGRDGDADVAGQLRMACAM